MTAPKQRVARVLLFVQTFAPHPSFPDGDDRIRSFSGVARAASGAGWIEGDGAGFVYSSVAMRAKKAARYWWLVECENATHGRIVIEHGGPVAIYGPGEFLGRILASGSRAPRSEGGWG